MVTLSIIIPIYNVEKYLDECLQSVTGIDDIEIILVNDCTPDNSIAIVGSYMEKYDNIKLILHNENKGLGATRNTGIKHATGKYVFFLDSDDYVKREKLESLLKILKESEYEQILISFIRFDDRNQSFPLEYDNVYKKYHNQVLEENSYEVLANIINISPIRIIKLEKIRFDKIEFPNGLYEDVLWSYWFAYSCKSTLVLDNRMYCYRQHSASILGGVSKKHFDIIKQYKRTLDLFKLKNVSFSKISILEKRFIISTKYVLFSMKRIPPENEKEFSKEIIMMMDSFLLRNYNKVKQLEIDLFDKSKEIEKLDTAFTYLNSIRFRYNPIKKFKALKQLIHTIRR